MFEGGAESVARNGGMGGPEGAGRKGWAARGGPHGGAEEGIGRTGVGGCWERELGEGREGLREIVKLVNSAAKWFV